MRDALDEIDDLQGQVERLENALAGEREQRRKWEKLAKSNRAEADRWKILLRTGNALIQIHNHLKETK